MNSTVSISFECTPLRSVARWDSPPDATREQRLLIARIKEAARLHGLHNSFYLSDGVCEFRLTNALGLGAVAFRFEGTVLTDSHDRTARFTDLMVTLYEETCDWLTAAAVEWLKETVVRAVKAEFDRYIASGDLERTRQRLERIEAEMAESGGFVTMGI